ncbi:hypothetical protein D3C77_804850 [compost metagenome]
MPSKPVAASTMLISWGQARGSRNSKQPQASVKNALNWISNEALPGGTPMAIPRLIKAHIATPKIKP